jgi:ferritin-like protein
MAMTVKDLIAALRADLTNEWQHLHFYLYHASAVQGLHAAEYREFLSDAADGEKAHIQQFHDRLFGLGADVQPCAAILPFPAHTDIEMILQTAIQLERAVVANFTQHLADLEDFSGDPVTAAYFKVFYEDQLQDSYEDIEKMLRMVTR